MVNLKDIKPNFVTPFPTDKIWLFYGEMGTRKTSVACHFPKHLLFAYDIGYKFINGAMAVPMQSWSDFKSAVKQLDQKEIKESYDIVVIDTIGMAYQQCYNYMLNQMGVTEPGEAGGYGMGWKKIRNEFELTLRSITQKGYGLIMLGHSDEVEKEDKVSKKKITQVKVDIDKRPDLIIKGLADFVFFLHKEPSESNNELTVYAYNDLESIDTKTRSRYFSRKFEFTYSNLRDELDKAVRKQYEAEGLEMPKNFLPSNPYVIENVNFNKLLNDTKNIAQILLDAGFTEELNRILIDIFKGVKLSDLNETEDNIDKLQVAYQTLDDLKRKARI